MLNSLIDLIRPHVGELLVAIGGGATTLAAWFRGRAKERDDLHNELNEVKIELAQIKYLLSAASSLSMDELTLEKVKYLIAHNSNALDDLTAFVRSCPKLIWIKRRMSPGSFVMIQVSNLYAQLYLGKPADYYAGKHDNEIYPEDVARDFGVHDEEAFVSGRIIHVEERVDSQHTGVRGTFKGIKWAFSLQGRHYVCGLGDHIADDAE